MTSALTAPTRVDAATVRRFLAPKSVAIVGASPSSPRHAVRALLDSDLEVHLVNPRHDTMFGVPAVPDLTSLDGRVDAVLTLVNARAAVAAVTEAASIGAAGVAVNAAGFAEVGEHGAALQADLIAAAGDRMAVLGPNCNGFVNAHTGAFLAGAPELPLRPGSVGVITHSGGFITDLAVAAQDRRIGFSALVSTGNEAVTDLVDYLEYFVDDPGTQVICLVIERIARPAAFFAAAERARLAGKPIVALKLGRSDRARAVARSHTGAIVGESWTYDAAFRQYGIMPAADLGDLLDRVMLFDQLPRQRWTPVNGLSVIGVSGGGAALVSDLCEQEGVALPALSSVAKAVSEILPAAGVLNPLDMTGFVMSRPDLVKQVVQTYVGSDEVDAVLTMWTLGLRERGFADAVLLPFAEVAAQTDKPMVLSMTADGRLSDWAAELTAGGLAVSPGLRATVRSFAAMATFARVAARPGRQAPPAPTARTLDPADVVDTPDGQLLSFTAGMRLLRSVGIAVAPFAIVPAGQPVAAAHVDFAAPYVVKLADCAHRTDIGAIRIGVPADGLVDAVAGLRELAAATGLPADVAVQPLLRFDGELFLGAQLDGDLGPVVACGLGGVAVEARGQVAGRLAPVSPDDAEDLLGEMDTIGVFAGLRGAAAWDRPAVAEAVVAISDLVRSAEGWLLSLDVNPLVRTADGFVAVDLAAFVRAAPTDPDTASSSDG